MRIVLAVVLAFALGAAAPSPQVDGDPVTLIAALYRTYQDIGPGEDGMPGIPNLYSKRLQVLIDKDAKETPEGMVGRIDWDAVVDGQDWQLTELKISQVSRSETAAQVRATFKNFDHQSNMLFDLVLEGGHWRIDDIEKTLPPRWTMSKILMVAADAFPDAESSEKPDER